MFTTPCFIRKNTPELRKKLEKLGYEPARIIFEESNLGIATSVNKEYAKYSTITYGMFDTKDPYSTWNCVGRIDCGTNEELFLTIAALRDDSDEYQWFVYNNTWFKCDFESIEDKRIEARNNNYFGASIYNCHKATVEELIEHFKNKHHGR